ncbi:MAG: chromate transporter [Firmicutes bacterium]|nr:chromate transporter [Bacillota bacterium]
MEEKKLTPLQLFLYYFKIGWFTFGGGWSIVAQMQKDFVEADRRLSSEDLLDIISMARSLPGTMIGNVAYLFGFRQAGVLGGVLAVFGIVTPPLIILTILTFCYTATRDNPWVAAALNGVRAAVMPIIFSAIIKLWKGAFPKRFLYLVFAATAVLSFYFKVSAVFLILMGVAIGILFGREKEAAQK